MDMSQLAEPTLSFCSLAGDALEVPAEWAEAFVIVSGVAPGSRHDVTLSLQGQRLECVARRLPFPDGPERFVAAWPRSGAGYYLLKCQMAAQQGATLPVRISPAKMDAGAFAAMIEDLESRLPASIALGLQQLGGLMGIRVLPPAAGTLAQELARLSIAVFGQKLPDGQPGRPGLLDILREIGDDAHRALIISERWVPLQVSRRPSPSGLVRAVALAGNVQDNWMPSRVVDNRVESSYITHENRLVQAYYCQVARRLTRLERLGQGQPWLSTVMAMRAALQRSRRAASFLDEVPEPTFLPDQLTMVLQRRASYRAALQGYQELNRQIAAHLEHPGLNAPLENVPSLYQSWGTLQVLRVLLEVAVEAGYLLEHQTLFTYEHGRLFLRLLPDGAELLRLRHPEGTVISLRHERSFVRRSNTIRSVSFTQRPDVTLEVVSTNASPRLYLFDPKYKLDSEYILLTRPRTGTGLSVATEDDSESESSPAGGMPHSGWTRPKKVDLDKMHAYRDAIRLPDGSRAVQYAAVLYPGQSVHYSAGLAALQAYPGREDALAHELTEVFKEALRSSEPLVVD